MVLSRFFNKQLNRQDKTYCRKRSLTQVQSTRILFLMAIILYPSWAWVVKVSNPEAIDGFWSRFIFIAPALTFYLLSYFNKFVRKHIFVIFCSCMWIISAHFFYLIYLNAPLLVYWVGTFIMFFCASIAMSTRKSTALFAFCWFILALIVTYLVDAPISEVVFIVGLMSEFSLIIVMTDIRQRTLQSLRESEKETRLIIDTAMDAIIQVDETGNILTWNPQACRLFGWQIEEVVNKKISDILVPESYQDLFTSWLKEALHLNAKGISSDRSEFVAQKKNKKLLDAEFSAVPLYVRKTLILNLFVRDITEKKEAAIAMAQAKEEAEEANRSKSVFLANMSHEIRTPLNAIIGFSELLQESVENQEQREFADTIRESGSALLDIINNILDVSKIEARKIVLEHVDFDIKQLIESTIRMVQVKAKDKLIKFVFKWDKFLPCHFNGDPTRLRQILLNLISNAVKFTDSGCIRVSVESTRVPNDQKTDIYQLQFAVEDTGIGIAEDKINHIFDAFQQADASITRHYGGTGLGLTITKRLIELMGGVLEVASKENQGSRFSFSLNLIRAQDNAPIKKPTVSQNKRVLVVDSDAHNRRFLGELCHQVDFTVINALASCVKARDWLENSVLLPDVILIDASMPTSGAESFTLGLTQNQNFKDVEIVVLVTKESNSKIDLYKKMGIKYFLEKPIVEKAFFETIQRLLTNTESVPLEEIRQREIRLNDEYNLKGIRVLVAEDNQENLRLLSVVLKKWGCQKEVALNGWEAVRKMRQMSFDICIMDLQMPGMGGMEATRIIRHDLGQGTPIIGLTASAMKEDEEKGYQIGMNDYLTKPIEVAKLKSSIIRWTHVV